MLNKDDYQIDNPTWCPGCGLFGVFEALKRAAVSLSLAPEELAIVTGIGCHGRFNNYFKSYGFHGLHGRALPVAQGIKISNPSLTVIGVSGDGDAYSIGAGHFIHAVRRNVGLTYLVVNNSIYGLTEGQTSPTSARGFVSISTPFGSKEYPLDGPSLALAASGGFIARGFSGNVTHLSSIIQKGLSHRGFALIDILSPCVTHNKVNTYDWYKQNIFPLDERADYDCRDKKQAREMLCGAEKIPVGLIYSEERSPFEALVLPKPDKPIVFNDLTPNLEKLTKIMVKFK
jgi:2-oxoglutarate ferredoxin oxidoreductase subunit beta